MTQAIKHTATNRRRFAGTALVVILIAALFAPAPASGPMVPIIVEHAPGAGTAVQDAVAHLGGSVDQTLSIIDGFTAEVPSEALVVLQNHPNVEAVTPDSTVVLLGKPEDKGIGGDGDHGSSPDPAGTGSTSFGDTTYSSEMNGSMHHVVMEATKAHAFWTDGDTGVGVTVALIDSGVVPVEGLTMPGKVINGPDLSFESQADNLRYLDTFGHGTHMAGIIAGNNTGDLTPLGYPNEDSAFLGVAPGASILNVKVADHEGAVDVSQVIAAIDWVVQHRNDNGMNVRVLNLSFGTDSTQSYLLDPLAHAVEQAVWYGIVVVVAAGNDGNVKPLRNPALDPYVIAVGAANTNGTPIKDDDTIPVFGNCGNADRHVDIAAPAVSIVSLRAPGSYADLNYPSARVDDIYFKGTGTSQAAAVVSGGAALLLSRKPNLNPHQVKNLLMNTAAPVEGAHEWCQGAGIIDLQAAQKVKKAPGGVTPYTWSLGIGSLEAARGSLHVYDEGVELNGEYDIFGQPFVSAVHALDATWEQAWSGGDWNGSTWTGASWSGASWSGASWSSASWSGASWSGASWSSKSWSDNTWNGASWSGASWSGASWSGASWSGASWSGQAWSGLSWR
jgi:serine protease AprX